MPCALQLKFGKLNLVSSSFEMYMRSVAILVDGQMVAYSYRILQMTTVSQI